MRRSMKRVNVKKENKPFKTLAIATIAGLSIIGVGQAQATTLDEVDLSQKPIDTPTLDYLHKNDVFLPQKTFQRDADGNIVKDSNNKPIIQEGTPILAPQSGYSLTELDAKEDGSKPDGDNVITKFEVKEVTRYYDKTTGELVANPISGTEYKVVQEKDLVPVYYSVNLKQTEYGNKDATNKEEKYYSWSKDSNGNNTLTAGTASSRDITYYVDKDRLSERITTNQNGANINKDFIGNTATSEGGAIYNDNSTIGDITGDFIGNTVTNYSSGGAIYNRGTIGNITGDFIDNTAYSGGAIYNYGTIGDITGDFIGNAATSPSSSSSVGGAIYNRGTIGNITGDFIGNTSAECGAIYNDNGTIGDITGDFIGNYAKYKGGAIYNNGTIGDITGNFIGNTSAYSFVGGAIYNSRKISDITGNFIRNSARQGGAIYNDGTTGNITGNFIGNYAYYSVSAYGPAGGAIYNYGTIRDITGNFIGNTSAYQGGAIYNYRNSRIGNITGDFIGNYASSSGSVYGGAIYNYENGIIGNITGDFIGNYASSSSAVYGGAIYNYENGIIGDITGDFIGNYAKSETGEAKGGAIYNDSGTIGDITGSFIGNYAKSESGTAQGGAIWSNRDLNIVADNGESVFSGNYVQNGDKKDPQAIFATNMIEKKNLGYNNEHSHSFYQNEPHKATVTLNSINNGKIIFNDKITGEITKTPINKYYNEWVSGVGNVKHYFDDNYNEIDTPTEVSVTPELKITGDSSSIVQLNNNIENLDISLSGTTLHLGARDNVLDGNNLDLQSGTLSMVNNQVGVASLNNVTLSGNTNFVADVDLANAEMDRISATNYGTHNGNLNVVGMNLLSDSTKDVTEIYFAQPGLKDNVVNGMSANGGYNLPSSAQTTFYTPIYKYNAIYDNRDDAGYFVFAKGDKILTPTPGGGTTVTPGGGGGITVTPTGNPSDAFNPAVLSSSVASQAGANATMNQTFNYAFQNSDNFMSIPYLERISIKNANRYALSPTGDATDVGTFSPLFNAQKETSSAWVKPYASFENIPLKNGPKVSNITYGTLVGFDTPIKSIRHGWDRTWTGYVGYNGASQRFSGVDAIQNGGLVGGTLTLYKNNFFNATTVSTGAIVGNNRTMYGTDNYTMLMAGVGNKTGYNIEFKEGKLIIQPSILLSYTFVNTFDYTNAAGVRIKNDPLHAIQIAPGVKFIANTKNGWQPYIGVNMVWNLLDKSKVSADDVRLPEMSIKPYIQYGVGVQKRFKDRYMAFGQAMIQNGGRNGISLTAGFRWALGKEGKPLEKVQRVNNKTISSSGVGTSVNSVGTKSTTTQAQPERKIIKQLSQTQRERIAKQYQNTTRTTSIGTLKQL